MIEHKIYRYKKLKSTNSKTAELQAIERLPEFSVVITSKQIAGRGLLNNAWESENNKNLTFSMVLYPKFIEVQNQFTLTFVVSVAISDVLKKYIPNIRIKWPNDIYYGDKKMTGILIENTIIGNKILYSIVGIGVNVNQTKFISDAPNPTSMKLLTGIEFDTEKLLNDIIDAIIFRYNQCEMGGFENIYKEYHDRLYRIGEEHCFRDKTGNFKGQIIKVEKTGHLVIIDSENKQKRYSLNEIRFFI
ncbi:MAG: biotin--[acetyl-CoA-carboxylase] ligase [Marinilabiliaceae bacterium]|nr:biotin--[acetyl-CoA-carboxylase] ligase [Marinilabiliaceae bacterium]